MRITLATALVLQAIARGHRYGFEIVDVTGYPTGTVYPALRRLEHAGYVHSRWETERAARAELRHDARADDGFLPAFRRSAGAAIDALWLRVQDVHADLWWGDVRFACRHAARRPAFALLVMLTVALGVGAGGAVFAMIDAVL